MELKISRSELSKALSTIQNIVEKKNTMPILANVLLSAQGETLKASATDLEITALVEAPASISSEGSTTVNAKVLYELVRELPEDEVVLKLTEGQRLEITSGSASMRIIGVSADEYPSLPGIGLTSLCSVDSQQLSEMITKSIYAVSTDETRFNLNGICFEMTDEQALRMVATDGHRLAMVTRTIDGLKFEGSALVPRKGLMEIKKMLDSEEASVGLSIDDGFMMVQSPRTKVSMRLIDGEFPDYKQVLPKQKGKLVKVNSTSFISALKRTALLVTEKTKTVRLDFSEGKLTISSSSPELGDAQETIDVEGNETLSIGFNANYLADVASSIEAGSGLVIELNGELGPAKLHAESDDSCFGIVMPMRLV